MTDHKGKKVLADLLNGLDGVTPGPWEVSYSVLGDNPENERLYAFLQRVEYEELTGVIDETPEGDDPPSPILEHLSRCSPDNIRAMAEYVSALQAENERLREALKQICNFDDRVINTQVDEPVSVSIARAALNLTETPPK